MEDSPSNPSRFNVRPVTAIEQQNDADLRSGGRSVTYAETEDFPERTSLVQDIDDIGYITCERYDKTRRMYNDSDEEDTPFGDATFEAMPRETNYVVSLNRVGRARPTIMELREDEAVAEVDLENAAPKAVDIQKDSAVINGPVSKGVKFGWIRGVFMRCLLNIWGVLLFMRLSWVVGQAGLGLSVAILMLAAAVITITTLSMSAISTNGAVKGGGTYFLISRSLGPEFGGAVGIIFSLANAAAVGMNTVGFAEALVELLARHNLGMVDSGVNDIRIIGVITVVGLLAITLVGMEWEARTQIILFGVIIASLINFFVGSFIPASDFKKAIGITGYSADTFAENFWPAFGDGQTFMTIFGIFFPACTGIMAGANISGDLKDAQKAIPKGTLSAIGVSITSYLMCALVVAAVAVRDATGSIADVMAGNLTECDLNCVAGDDGCKPCKWGISNSYLMMTEISAFGPIITTGVFAASLSSALACLVSAPKIFQALCRDKIFPLLEKFGKGFGKNDEPLFGYILTFVIGCGIVLIGDLNVIAPVISNFYIGTYALINYACFDASLSSSPGFRPAFRYYNMWLSLFGALLCIACMFMMNWWGALVTIGVLAFLWIFVHHKQPDVNWGSSIQARAFKSTVQSAWNLIKVEDHVKNFRPQVLVLSGLPASRPLLVYFVNTFTKDIGMMVCGHILVGDQRLGTTHTLQRQTYSWFREKHIKSFYNTIIADSFRQGARALIQTVGIGKMRPNMVMMGFTKEWMVKSAVTIHDYVDSISDAFDANMGVGILRIQEGMDVTLAERDITASTFDLPALSTMNTPVRRNLSMSSASQGRKISLPPIINERLMQTTNGSLKPESSTEPLLRTRSNMNINIGDSIPAPFGSTKNLSRVDLADKFHAKAKEKIVGEIHVYWLYDDGGLTLLIPHILSKKSPWNGCKLKIFYLQGKQHQVDEAQRNMVALLSKFRIEFSDAVAVNINKPPSDESVIWFNQMIEQFRAREPGVSPEDLGMDENHPAPVTNADLEAYFERTQRQIRLRELLKEHSSAASLIVMTLPVPKRNCNPTLYMAWLETLTEGMPPILLLRGNQQSVMTFYS